MRALPMLGLLVLTMGCTVEAVTIGDGEGLDLDGDGIPDDQQQDDEDEPEPEPPAWVGSWVGEMGLIYAEWGNQACRGEAVLEITLEGEATGGGLCEAGDWMPDVEMTFEGQVDEQGQLSGAIFYEVEEGPGGDIELEPTDTDGDVSGEDLVMEWAFAIDAGWDDLEMQGYWKAAPE